MYDDSLGCINSIVLCLGLIAHLPGIRPHLVQRGCSSHHSPLQESADLLYEQLQSWLLKTIVGLGYLEATQS